MKSFLRRAITLVLAALTVISGYSKIGVQYQAMLGNPSNATTDASNYTNYLIERPQYAISYNDDRGVANWVSWNLTAEDIGSSGRSAFMVDPDLPATFYAVLTTDYQSSGYDRGHMCPSADRTVTTADNQVTFYMSNMVPQAPDNNQGVWANFESYCRSLANLGNELLITSGPSGFGGSLIPSGAAEIPGYVWKVVVVVPSGSGSALDRITTDTRVIAIKIPNIAGVRSDPWQNYLTNVAEIEADTGFTFFSTLPPAIANALRVKIDGQVATGSPVVTSQPSAQTTALGGSVSFTVTATGNAPLSYQWIKDDAEIPGATTATLQINNVQANDAGSYYVVVTNAVGSTTSNQAALIISGLPPVISSQPSSQAVPAGSTVNFAVTAVGSPPLSYQWSKDSVTLTGATSAALLLSNVQEANAGTYSVTVTNPAGIVASALAVLTVTPTAPVVVTPPLSKIATVGEATTLTVVAAGTEPLSYQWRKEGTPISGATSASLTLNNLSGADAGSYDVVITNAVGSVTSPAAILTVNAATVYWNFSTATPTSGLPADIAGGTVIQGNNNGTTTMLTTSSASGSYSGASGTYNAGAAARTGALNVAAAGSAYFEFTLSPDAGKRLVINGLSFGSRSTSTGPQAYSIFTSYDNFASPLATGTLSNNSAWTLQTPTFTPVSGSAGAPVTVRIFGHNGTGSPGANTANWRIDDLKVTISTVVVSSAIAPTVVSTTPISGATAVLANQPLTVTFNQPVSISAGWFTIQSAVHGPISATVTGGPVTYTLTPPTDLPFGDVITATIKSGKVTEKDTNAITLASDYTWSFSTSLPVAPSITTQPTSLSVGDGAAASLSVAATGTGPLSYTWRKNGVAIAGNATAGNSTLVILPATLADSGTYDVVVSNVAGTLVSSAVTLTVNAVAPTIVSAPAGGLYSVGSDITLAVTATGSAPLTYTWRKDGVALGVPSAPTLALSAVTAADAGLYDVVVSNSVGSTTSTGALIGVTAATLGNVTWNFTTPTPTSGLPTELTGGAVTQGNNNGTTTVLTTTSASGSYTGASGGNNAGAAARTGAFNASSSAYFEFAFTPAAADLQAVLGGLAFGSRSTGTGPKAYAVYTSADNFTTPVATGALTSDSTWRKITTALTGARGTPGQPLTVRIYGYAGTGSAGVNTANWRIDDVTMQIGTERVPMVVSTAPQAGASEVALNAPITLGFNQPVAGIGEWATLSSATRGALPAVISGGPETYTITPASSYNYGEVLTLTIHAAQVRDLTGTLAMPADVVVSYTSEVARPPVFTQEPSAQTVTAFTPATFQVSATGTAPFSYQWRRDGVAITDNPSANTAQLMISSATVSTAGSYDCVVTNIAGTATSAAATLTVTKAPASVSLSALSAIYNGSPKPVMVATTPTDLAVAVSYDGTSVPPTNAGSYAVVATIDDPNYSGQANGVLVIAPAQAQVQLSGLQQTYDGQPKPITVATTPAGLATAVTYAGAQNAPTAAGSYPVVATIANSNYTGQASGTLVIAPATATISLSGLAQIYDGTPRVVTATTVPADLPVTFTYDGASSAPVLPGSYVVQASVDSPNYAGSVTAEMRVSTTVWVKHAPSINGGVDGSVLVSLPESLTLNGGAWITGDLLVPGTPTVRVNGKPVYAGVLDAGGIAAPTSHSITLNGNSLVRYIVRQVDADAFPVVSAPPAPSGTQSVSVNNATQGSQINWTTLRNLTLNSNAGTIPMPVGNYGSITINGNGTLVLGTAGSTVPATYNLQSLTINGSGKVIVAGPVVLTVASSVALNGPLGTATNPEWLTLRLSSGSLTLNGNTNLHGAVVAPNSTVTVNGSGGIRGSVVADRLTVNGSGVIEIP